jgi:hypothetical protein
MTDGNEAHRLRLVQLPYYSFLANLRVERLSSLGVADVEWRAVVHDPDVPPGGLPVVGELAGMFDRELDEIRGLLRFDEPYPARRPTVQPNTTLAVAGYSTATRPRWLVSFA